MQWIQPPISQNEFQDNILGGAFNTKAKRENRYSVLPTWTRCPWGM